MSETKTEQRTLTTISLLVIATVALAVALIYTRPVMVPFVLALLLSYLVRPLVDWIQERTRLPRGLAIVLAILAILGLFALLALIIASSISNLGDNAALYRDRLTALTAQVTTWLTSQGVDLGQGAIMDAIRELPLLDWVKRTAGGAMNALSNTFLVLLFIIYLVAQKRPARPADDTVRIIERKIRRYLAIKFLLSLATGVLVGGILWILGVDLALVFGLMALLLNFVPNIGSIAATLLPLPIVLMQFDSTALIILAIALPGAVQLVIGNVLEPKMLGESVDLNPIAILISLVFWGLLWGVVGMLLATPITAVIKIQLERFAVTRPVARLLGNETPAPPPDDAPPPQDPPREKETSPASTSEGGPAPAAAAD